MTRLFLLRHGATAANREVPYRLQGRASDRPLDETGQLQAEAAAQALSHQKIAAVYSSPLLRAVQTAEAVATLYGLKVDIEALLIEADIGTWEGLTWDQVAARDPERHRLFMADPGTTPYPEGESFADAGLRASKALQRLAAAHENETIAIVAHNILNRGYLAPLLGVPMAKARDIRQSNTGINLIEIEGDRSTVITLNSVLHLDGIAGIL
jgi:broad specificity phosphatase PhoE